MINKNDDAVTSGTAKVSGDKNKYYYATLRANLNAIHNEIQNAPNEFKMGFQVSPGGILNAYREGDIDFKTAIKYLKEVSPKLVRCKVFSVDFSTNEMTISIPKEILEQGITAGDIFIDMREITPQK